MNARIDEKKDIVSIMGIRELEISGRICWIAEAEPERVLPIANRAMKLRIMIIEEEAP